MNEYIDILKELLINFSYERFVNLLKEIDIKLIDSGTVFGEEFLFYFNQLINFTNDDYIIDGKSCTLGHKLVEDTLLNKKKITPSILLCFYLEQKNKIGLENFCNEVVFGVTRHMASTNFRMAVVKINNINQSYMCINHNNSFYKRLEENIDEYNYQVLNDILHELTHVYQLSRSKNKGNIFDRLARYDYDIGGILNDNNVNCVNPMFHESLVCEFMAQEQARVYLLKIALDHPEYFNSNLTKKERENYSKIRLGIHEGTFNEYLYDVRVRFDVLLSDIKKYNQEKVTEVLDKIDILRKESQPLIEQLKREGISERMEDNYYSIFLKSLYHFDGKDIILIDTPERMISKGI